MTFSELCAEALGYMDTTKGPRLTVNPTTQQKQQFQRMHGTPYDPKSSMDRGKMQQIVSRSAPSTSSMIAPLASTAAMPRTNAISYPVTTGAAPTTRPAPMITGGGAIPVQNNKVNPQQLESYIAKRISQSSLNGFVPADGQKFGVDGSPESWAKFFTRLANRESSFKITTVGDVGRFAGNSNGLFQLSPNDALNHKLQPQPFSQEQLLDPVTNTNAAIAIAERLIGKSGVIAAGGQGMARYWGPLKRGEAV